jgi:hypothetical protein
VWFLKLVQRLLYPGGSERRALGDVMLVIVDDCGVRVRLIPMRRTSTWVPDQCCWRALAKRGIWIVQVALYGIGCCHCNI